jgi:hypothetical protein
MTKSAYWFFTNERVDEGEILFGHFQQIRVRMEASEGSVLMLHDTTEFTCSRENPSDIDYTRTLPTPEKLKRVFGNQSKASEILMYTSLAVTPAQIPIGEKESINGLRVCASPLI